MTGNQLKQLRAESGKKQKDFYGAMGFKGAYGSLIEKHYGDGEIPKKLGDKVRRRYKNLLKGE